MAQVRRFSAFGLASLLSIFSMTAIAQSGDLAAIQQRLSEQYRLTTTMADRSDIVTAGDVVTIHKPGLVMFSGTAVPATNNYKNGALGQGFGTIMIMSNPNTVQRQFVPGEKFWVTGIYVQKDGVTFKLFSDPYNGFRYYGDLKFLYPNKKVVPPLDSVLQTIAEVLTVDGQSDQQESAPAPDSGAARMQGRFSQGQPAPAPEVAPAPMPAIAPPPPPSDAPPPVIALGQTEVQVTAAFGQPLKIAKLGAKEIFYYKDMKVTFTDGSVTNVE